MRINQNISAMNTYSRLTVANNAKSKSLEKLSSGLRINRAGDDAAGLAISEKMRGQIGGLKQAIRNAQDGISLIQTAEGALNETHSILQRMRELAVQAQNGTYTEDDKQAIQDEIDQLAAELDRIADTTQFNKQGLLDGTLDTKFQIGANQNNTISLAIKNMSAAGLGVGGTSETTLVDKTGEEKDASNISLPNDGYALKPGKYEVVDVSNNALYGTALNFKFALKDVNGEYVGFIEDATSTEVKDLDGNVVLNIGAGNLAEGYKLSIEGKGLNINDTDTISRIDNAIELVSAERSKLGAVQNRLEHTINNLTATAENLSAAESRIRDVDMAEEMMEFTKNNILSQAATAMLAQANQMPNSVLQLLQ